MHTFLGFALIPLLNSSRVDVTLDSYVLTINPSRLVEALIPLASVARKKFGLRIFVGYSKLSLQFKFYSGSLLVVAQVRSHFQ